MAVYSDLADIVVSIFEELNKSTDFLRLMSNDEPDALENPPKNTMNEMFNVRLFPIPFTTEPVEEKGSYMHIWFNTSNMAGVDNIFEHDIKFNVVFFSHAESWQLDKDSNDKNRIRTYELLDIIESTLQGMTVSEAIRGQFVVSPPIYTALKNEFCGYRFTVEITDDSSKVCDF